MDNRELINAISAVLCREKHFSLIKSNHAADEMAEDIVKMLIEKAESVECFFYFDKEKQQHQAKIQTLKFKNGKLKT